MKELIFRSQNGDKEAYTELIKLIQNDLYRIARSKLTDLDDINDAIQETIIKSYKKLNKLQNIDTFKSWIIKILINECNQIYRKKSKKNSLINKLYKSNSMEYNEDSIHSIDSKLDFEKLLYSLSTDEKLIITLFYNSNYSCSEISKILNMNINTVKSKIARAKEKIRKEFEGGILNV
jgi:RNA polymerase sigma-70 factor (ECF subfamily)